VIPRSRHGAVEGNYRAECAKVTAVVPGVEKKGLKPNAIGQSVQNIAEQRIPSYDKGDGRLDLDLGESAAHSILVSGRHPPKA
jgi:hypothetical protein